MSLTKRLKSLGSPIKDAATAYVGFTAAGAKDLIPTTETVKGAAHGDVGDIAKIGFAAAAAYSGARGLRSAATTLRAGSAEAGLASRLAKTPLKFPVADPEATFSAGVKNRVLSAMQKFDPVESPRTRELKGKIKSIRTELASMEGRPSTMAQTIKKAPPSVSPGERGSLRFPRHATESVQKAHANVPEGQLLFTVEKDLATPLGMTGANDTMAFTKKARIDQSAARSAAMDRQVADVRSGRARLAGFYEKVKGEEGWVRAVDKPAVTKTGLSGSHKTPAHTEIRFGEGKFPGESALGEGPLKKGFYEASVMGSKEKGAVKIAWLKRTGNPGNVARPVEAVVKGLKARGISAIEHEPLSASRSRLFARQLRKMGLKNIDRNAPDIKKKKPSLASGWGR